MVNHVSKSADASRDRSKAELNPSVDIGSTSSLTKLWYLMNR